MDKDYADTEDTYQSLNSWCAEDKPRERYMKHGFGALKDHELIAMMIGSGVKGLNVIDLSKQIVDYANGSLSALSDLTLDDLRRNFKGIGEAKGIQILAALELGRRRSIEVYNVETIKCSKDIVHAVAPLFADSRLEQFWILLLNRQNGIIGKQCVAQGGTSMVLIDPKLVLKPAIERLATSIVLCHNHPSGSITPSRQDDDITKKLLSAASVFDIKILDHVIITPDYDRYYSYYDEGNVLY